MNPQDHTPYTQDDTSYSAILPVTSTSDDDDIFLLAHDVTATMKDAEELLAEVDAGRTALKGDQIVLDESNSQGYQPQLTDSPDTSYLGEIEIGHPEEQQHSVQPPLQDMPPLPPQDTQAPIDIPLQQQSSELPTENRLIPGSYDVRNQSPMHSTVAHIPQSVQDPFLMG